MSITKKTVFAGAFALAFAIAGTTNALAADPISARSQSPVSMVDVKTVTEGDNHIALYDAEHRLRDAGLNPDNFHFSGKTGREISSEMYVLEVKSGS